MHSLARQLAHDLQHGMKQREAEYLQVAGRVGSLETKLGALDEVHASLAEMKEQLGKLGRSSAIEVESRPAAAPVAAPAAAAESGERRSDHTSSSSIAEA